MWRRLQQPAGSRWLCFQPLRRNVSSMPAVGGESQRRVISPVIAQLEERGMVHGKTSSLLPGPVRKVDGTRTGVYAGFDPTADSLHVGNLLTLIALLHFQQHGYQPIALIGGATGAVGDPSGKSTDRVALSASTVRHNAEKLNLQIQTLWERCHRVLCESSTTSPRSAVAPALVVNNLDWLQEMTLLDFLQTVGRHARVNEMIDRDSVQTRLQTSGISFTEFTYQLLQAFDFEHLYRHHQCRIQVGGSDQWGNIIAGTDLIRKKLVMQQSDNSSKEAVEDAHGLTIPLLTTKSGEKFGKSAGNAIWLDASKTSYFDFYQFFVRTEDGEVEKLLRFLTFQPLSEIQTLMERHRASPEERLAQRNLADTLTKMVHGEEGLQRAHIATRVLFGESLHSVSVGDLLDAFQNDTHRLARISFVSDEPILDFLKRTGSCASKNEARRLVQSKGVHLNDVRVESLEYRISERDFRDRKLAVVRAGKKNYKLVERKE